MNHSDEWGQFYDAIKDVSWPKCDVIDDFIKLPDHIKIEILKDHLFSNNIDNLIKRFKARDLFLPKSFFYHQKIMNIIGAEHCQMNSQDVIFLYSMIYSKKPESILEIGRYHGWSSAIMFGALDDIGTGHLYSIDIENNVDTIIEDMIKSRTTLITGNSNDLLEMNEIKNNRFSMFFIDGDHSYDQVIKDLKNCYQLSTTESWFLLHDMDCKGSFDAVNDWSNVMPDVVNCGIYGEKIGLLYKKEIR